MTTGTAQMETAAAQMEIVVHGRTGFTRLIVCESFNFASEIKYQGPFHLPAAR